LGAIDHGAGGSTSPGSSLLIPIACWGETCIGACCHVGGVFGNGHA
jgi:hypothetical protein